MTANDETNGGDDIFAKLSKAWIQLFSSFFEKKNAEIDHKTLRSGKKYAGANHLSCFNSR